MTRLGDAASVALTKILAGQKPSGIETEGALLIIRMAFDAPRNIQVEADQEPRTTMFLLQYLDSLSPSSEVRKKIAETRNYVSEQFAKWRQQRKL